MEIGRRFLAPAGCSAYPDLLERVIPRVVVRFRAQLGVGGSWRWGLPRKDGLWWSLAIHPFGWCQV